MNQRTYNKDMGYTHAEFFRLLPVALGSSEYVVSSLEINLSSGANKQLRIVLGPQGSRNIALLSIPVIPVSLYLSGYSDQEADDLMKLFERTYRRGGG